jgi:phosphopantothenoylcysteine decarboxylase / phosphopantothenate---cysteine ligase
MLKGKKILLGITGSIAAYKSVHLVRLLIKSDCQVRVITTPAARDFVSPLTLATLSKNQVLTDMFDEDSWANHVMLGRWADIMLMAPLSCNTLAKMAGGNCDNLLLAVYFSATCPVVVAPAMDEDMWHHPTTKKNLESLASFGNKILDVESGELASGLFGEGRMAEPESIVQFLDNHFHSIGELTGKKALVTAGPTYEPIDPVRFIGNHSSGKMGIAIARELKRRGADVTLVLGPVQTGLQSEANLEIIRVKTAEEMFNSCQNFFPASDITIMAAAVADYTPAIVADKKIKKSAEDFTIELKKTKDILKSLGEQKQNNQVLVGFALETDNEREHALGKLKSKNADMIVLNSLRDPGAGFGVDTNKITILDKSGTEIPFDKMPKPDVAKKIIDTLIRHYYA